MTYILVAHCLATLYMVGLIWFVQVVHYPLFDGVGPKGYEQYQARHVRRTGWVVGPPMLVEASSAAYLALAPTPGIHPGLAWLGVGLVTLIWLATATLQVPAHGRLEQGFDAKSHRYLVASNWLRTGAWTVRGALAMGMLVQSLSA